MSCANFQPTVKQIADYARTDVVSINTWICDKNNSCNYDGLGTGFFIDRNVIVTAYHVVDGDNLIKIKLPAIDNYQNNIASILAIDKYNDLAILYCPLLNNKRYLSLANNTMPNAGDPIVVIGSALMLENTVSTGIISSMRRIHNKIEIQDTAPISQGSSGSPLLNTSGEVIGIAVSIRTDGQNINFAVPVKHLNQLVKTIYR